MRWFSFTSLILIVIFVISGCSTFTPPAQMEQIKGSGTYWINYSSDRRGAIVHTTNGSKDTDLIKICAEPAPDTSENFELQGSFKKDLVAEVSGQTGQNVIVLPGRNSNVLSLRESLYRLCELSINRPDIPASDIMNAYNKVIIAVTKYAEAEAAKANATTEAIKNITSDQQVSSVKMSFSVVKDAELKGFQEIAKGNYPAALSDFSKAEALYPGYHNVYEIKNALNAALSDGTVNDTEKQLLFQNIINNWSWGAPNDILSQIKAQIK